MNLRMVLVLILLAGANLAAEVPPAIVGDYVEARSNHVYTCACLCSGEQVTGGREAILAWHIQDGSYRGVPLAGVKIVAVVVGESNLSTDSAPRKSVLYLDGITSNQQQQAALALLARHYEKAVGEIATVHQAPIAFYVDGERAAVTVGDTVHLETRKARLPEDAHPGSQLWYQPFVPMAEATLATTVFYKYWGSDLARQWWERDSGITGYLGKAVVRGQ